MEKSISGYGFEFEKRISEKTAKQFAGMYPLPRMGFEITVAIVKDKNFPSFKNYLTLQNVSGIYVLASCNVPKSDWPDVFKVHGV